MLKLVLLFTAIVAVHSQCFDKDDAAKKPNPEARIDLYKGQLHFTLDLFNSINEVVPDDNIFFSPFSVYHALLLGYIAAGGQTQQGLKHALKISDSLVSQI